MSCLPGTPCWSNQTSNSNTSKCGIDSCYTIKTGTDLVFYNGANLPCLGVDTCDTATVVFQKIDNKLCPDVLLSTIISTLATNPSLKNQLKTILGI